MFDYENDHYVAIKEFYGERKAVRSQLPLVNHINEGTAILEYLGADNRTIEAFCIHPLLQADEDYLASTTDPYSQLTNYQLHPASVALTMEYRHIANAYLSKHYVSSEDKLPRIADPRVGHMLIADKVQNYKDFLATYSTLDYDKYNRLKNYFMNWLVHLGLDARSYHNMVTELFGEL